MTSLISVRSYQRGSVCQDAVLREPLPVRAGRGEHDVVAHGPREAPLPADDVQARAQAFDVPLPRPGHRLVEVVDVEDEVALGARELAEVRDVRVATRLHAQARHRIRREVHRHHRGRAPEERER